MLLSVFCFVSFTYLTRTARVRWWVEQYDKKVLRDKISQLSEILLVIASLILYLW